MKFNGLSISFFGVFMEILFLLSPLLGFVKIVKHDSWPN
jgi:hypothetical protein